MESAFYIHKVFFFYPPCLAEKQVSAATFSTPRRWFNQENGVAKQAKKQPCQRGLPIGARPSKTASSRQGRNRICSVAHRENP
jgi:hypothetical protein